MNIPYSPFLGAYVCKIKQKNRINKQKNKKMEKKMNESVLRMLDFVNKHGGITNVSETIGVSSVLFYNYKNRGSKPNMEILELLAKNYEDFDSHYILTGESKLAELRDRVKMFEKLLQEKVLGKCNGGRLSLLVDSIEMMKLFPSALTNGLFTSN